MLAITEAMRAVDQGRAVVITGSGPVFSAGVDLRRIVAFSASKRQLQQPARDRIAARRGEEEAVAETWSSDRTRDAITRY